MTQALFAYCPQSLYGTGCADPSCTLAHDAKYCQLCAIICEPASSYDSHLDTPKHKKALEQRPSWSHCALCNVSLPDKPNIWRGHITGRPHRQHAARRGINPDSVQPTSPPEDSARLKRCACCDIILDLAAWDSHVGGRPHKIREQHAAFRSAFTRASQDREGVNVSHAEAGLDFGIVDLASAKKGVQSEFLVSTDSDASVTLVSAEVITAGGASSKNRKRMP